MSLRLGILGSTRGSNLLPIITAIEEKKLNANIAVTVSNKKDAGILQKAKEYHIPQFFVESIGLTREAYDKKISDIFLAHQVSLIVFIGYMRIVSHEFVTQWKNKIINVHPSLLPAFAGKMDLEVHRAVLDAKEKETGCTIHYVDEIVDAGPIILQKKCDVFAEDTPELLKNRVQQLEGQALIEVIQTIAYAST